MKRHLTPIFILGTLLFLVLAAYLRPNPAVAMQSGQPGVISDPTLIVSATEILRLDNHIVRFDTTTGELSRFSGTATGGAANGLWIRIARPVSESTSQYLQLRRVGEAVFLIDQVTGDTWVLRRASGAIGSWVNVQQQ